MTTSDYNGYWQNMQNDCQRCKIKVRKFLFDILWGFGVMEEKPEGAAPPGPDRIKIIFVWDYTKAGKSILRPASGQSNRKAAGPALILIERHIRINIISHKDKTIARAPHTYLFAGYK